MDDANRKQEAEGQPHHEYIRALIYVSGPYTAEYRIEVDANIARAQYASLSLWRQGFGCITPHLNSARFERLAPEVPYGAYLETYMSMIPLCQGMLMLPGWEESKGARIERQRGIDLGLIVANHQVLLMTAFPDTTTWRQHA